MAGSQSSSRHGREICLILRTASSIPDTIQYPTDPELRKWLTAKRREYTARKQDKKKPWSRLSHSNAYERFAQYRRTCHKEELLLAILRLEEPYQYIDLRVFIMCMVEKYGLAFDAAEFKQAKLTTLFYLGALKEAIERGEIESNPVFPDDHPYSENSSRNKQK